MQNCYQSSKELLLDISYHHLIKGHSFYTVGLSFHLSLSHSEKHSHFLRVSCIQDGTDKLTDFIHEVATVFPLWCTQGQSHCRTFRLECQCHHWQQILTNNSVIRANNSFLQGSFFRLSGRREAGIGRWIAPSGNNYTLPGTHVFEVSVGDQNNPGVVEISVSGSDSRFLPPPYVITREALWDLVIQSELLNVSFLAYGCQ